MMNFAFNMMDFVLKMMMNLNGNIKGTIARGNMHTYLIHQCIRICIKNDEFNY